MMVLQKTDPVTDPDRCLEELASRPSKKDHEKNSSWHKKEKAGCRETFTHRKEKKNQPNPFKNSISVFIL